MSRICLNEYTFGFRRAGRLIFGSVFASLGSRGFSYRCSRCCLCYEKRNDRVIPLRKERQSSAIYPRGCPIHLPPVTGHPHALRRHSFFRLSCVPPDHREGSLLVKHGIVWPGTPPVKAPGLLFPLPFPDSGSCFLRPLTAVTFSCRDDAAEQSLTSTPLTQLLKLVCITATPYRARPFVCSLTYPQPLLRFGARLRAASPCQRMKAFPF